MSQDVAIALREWMLGIDEVADLVDNRIHQDAVPAIVEAAAIAALEGRACEPANIRPYIWFTRSSTERDSCIDEFGTLPDIENFAIEVVSFSQGEVQAIADALHRMNGFRGAAGQLDLNALFVDAQSDEYEPYNPASTIGLKLSAIEIRVFPRR